MKKYVNIVMFSALLLLLNSCKDYLNINTDPNSPSEENLTSSMILPAAEMSIAATYSYSLHILGAYNVEYYAQQTGTPNYLEYSKFNVSPTNGNRAYTELFQHALNNSENVRKKAKEDAEYGVFLQATVLRSYAFHLLVDAFGEVPFTEALDGVSTSPKFDDGKFIYESLIAELDEAIALSANGGSLATSFILPNGTIADWQQFAKAEKLRLLSRINNVEDKSAQLQALIAENDFPASDIQIAGCWANSSGHANPFFAEEASSWAIVGGNVIANLALVETMNQDTYSDPRLAVWFKTNGSGAYRGSLSGANSIETTASWSSPNIAYNTPVVLCAKSEVEFFIAEFYARKGDAANAQLHYEAAINASFESAGVAGAEANIAQYPYDQSNWKQSIGLAKWIALAGVNGFESYTEVRRLDYPAFGTVKGSDMLSAGGTFDPSAYVPGTLYTPYQRFDQVGDNKLLERFPYPEASTSRNTNSPTFPGYLEPIFWGK